MSTDHLLYEIKLYNKNFWTSQPVLWRNSGQYSFAKLKALENLNSERLFQLWIYESEDDFANPSPCPKSFSAEQQVQRKKTTKKRKEPHTLWYIYWWHHPRSYWPHRYLSIGQLTTTPPLTDRKKRDERMAGQLQNYYFIVQYVM